MGIVRWTRVRVRDRDNDSYLKSLTSITEKLANEVCLFLCKDVDKFLKMSDTPTSEKLNQPYVSVSWLYHIVEMFSL